MMMMMMMMMIIIITIITIIITIIIINKHIWDELYANNSWIEFANLTVIPLENDKKKST